jgi:hypothetical protein
VINAHEGFFEKLIDLCGRLADRAPRPPYDKNAPFISRTVEFERWDRRINVQLTVVGRGRRIKPARTTRGGVAEFRIRRPAYR